MAIFTAAMQPERKTNHSIQSSAEVKNKWMFTSNASHAFITRTETLPHKIDSKVTTNVFCNVTTYSHIPEDSIPPKHIRQASETPKSGSGYVHNSTRQIMYV